MVYNKEIFLSLKNEAMCYICMETEEDLFFSACATGQKKSNLFFAVVEDLIPKNPQHVQSYKPLVTSFE